MTSTSSSKGFNYERTKQRFMELVEEQLSNPTTRLGLEMHSKENIKKRMNEIREKKAFNVIDRDFDVITKDGVDILVKKRSKLESGCRILSFDDIFDNFMKLHMRDNHAPKEDLLEHVAFKKFVFPNICVDLIIKACDVCNKAYTAEVIDRVLLETKGKSSVVYVVSIMQKRVDQHCLYLFIYVDTATNYLLLRPLMEKSEKEIALTLFQIFTQFGAPLTVSLCGYEPTLAKRVDSYLKKFCPMFQVEIKHKRMNFDLPTVVVQELEDWRNNSKSDFWELGCSIVQKELNNLYERNPIKHKVYAKPYELYFTESIKGGTKSSEPA